MSLFLRRYAFLDRRVFGVLYLGSTLWAVGHFAVGLALWFLGAYFTRAGAGPRSSAATLGAGLDPWWFLATLSAVCLAVLFRRSAPGAALAVGTAAVAADMLVGPSTWVLVTYGDVLYAACVWGRRRLAYGTLAVLAAASAALVGFLLYLLALGALPGGLLTVFQAAGILVLLFIAPMIAGLSVREHHLRAELERERARQIERMAELDRGNAIAEERGRMARELHDVIANHLSAIAVQSTAALSLRDPDPARIRRILSVVRDNSVQGLAEMRQMIGVLRAEDDLDLERVMPRLSEADRLVTTAREAGLRAETVETGTARPLPVGVDAAAYRILQECLTNALRYAEPRRVDITIDYGAPDAGGRALLVLTAENPVPEVAGHTWRSELGSGAGLAGMRERVALLGGDFEAGAPGGDPRRWRVRAALPHDIADGAVARGTEMERDT
ncbi:sensor histidine kinase [Nocardiopsis mangrovi]|uniref:histidine kinase n=1 Tax=Nocardiopsis mangrovi TaxID=1179818 RepID=A0ABV9E215_9ACTN